MSHPSSAGMTEVSIPAYDSVTGYMLISVGTQFGYLAGSGDIYVYKYEAGRLIYINRIGTWIS
jgi:hypothetical protein